MALTKYASFEQAEVLDVKGSQSRIRTASLDKVSEYEDYRTDDGYLYARIRAISSRVNKNNDGWPSIELAGSPELFEQRQSSVAEGFTVEAADGNKEYGFGTFIGKPIFVDHHNTDPKRTRGRIVDSKLNVLGKTAAEGDEYWTGGNADPEHLPATEVELLLEIDAKNFPKLAKAIIDGDIDGFSMGCDVEKSKCSHCGNEATSPQEYCDHIQAKGASFDFVDSKTGKKTSKKSYENCYGIKFFEISAVFDPADTTALTKEIRSSVHKEAEVPVVPNQMGQVLPEMKCPMCSGTGGGGACPQCKGSGFIDQPVAGEGVMTPSQIDYRHVDLDTPVDPSVLGPVRQGATKVAENPEPQSEHATAPKPVDTLREEKVCPVCGSDMDSEKCDVCGHIEPPDGYDNPDLTKAQQTRKLIDQSDGEVTIPPEPLGAPEGDSRQDGSWLQSFKTTKTDTAQTEITDMRRWTPNVHPKVAARLNRPTVAPATEEPVENVAPVTSTLRTARDMIEAAKRNKENTMAEKTADAASGAPEAATPDKRVDVEGVGGVIQDSNEQASKADAQVNPTGKGGVIQDSNEEASKADSQQSVGDRQEDNAGFQQGGEVGDKTKTFDDGSSKVERQADPVTNQAFPTSAVQGVKPEGGADVQPQRRVDVEQGSGFSNPQKGTDQWTGTDGNGVTKQQDPVTNVPTQSGGITSHIVAAFKLADTEVELGLTDKAKKYERVAELEALSPDELAAEERVVARVKTAGLGKQARTVESGVTRLPSFKRQATAAADEVKPEPVDNELLDAAVFTR